jgi:hypothetical protein
VPSAVLVFRFHQAPQKPPAVNDACPGGLGFGPRHLRHRVRWCLAAHPGDSARRQCNCPALAVCLCFSICAVFPMCAVVLVCVMQEKLGPQCMRWLEDQVASIREAATKTLQKIAQVGGAGQATSNAQVTST